MQISPTDCVGLIEGTLRVYPHSTLKGTRSSHGSTALYMRHMQLVRIWHVLPITGKNNPVWLLFCEISAFDNLYRSTSTSIEMMIVKMGNTIVAFMTCRHFYIEHALSFYCCSTATTAQFYCQCSVTMHWGECYVGRYRGLKIA